VYRDVPREYTINVPVWNEVEKEYTVMVAHQEMRQSSRRVCVMKPVTEMRTYCVDRGQWEEQTVPVSTCDSGCGTRRGRRGCWGGSSDCGVGCGDACGGAQCTACAAPQTTTRKVWVANIVREQREVTVNRPSWQDQPYEYPVTVCKPETRTKMVRVCSYQPKTITRIERICEYQTKTVTRNERVCEYQPKTMTRTVRVCEYQPKTVSRTVRVCEMETQTRTRQFQVCNYVSEERSRTIPFTVCVPQTKTRTYDVTEYERVAEQKKQTYQDSVPYPVERKVEVRVCKMVPKTITVPSCDANGGCNSGCANCRRG
jgi:hypothetical protein